ncbi:MAG: FGGY-family carbohydrate kinase [Spirochaetales bacterium]|jgi:xylulokinase|nr:FGGY-family carbohydrate kinase [Spirochaetales bacterium]
MPEPVFLCVDIGTSSLKGALFHLTGECLCRARANLPVAGASPFLNWEAREWTAAFRRLAADLTDSARRSERDGVVISGVVISGNGPTLVSLGADGEPVHPVLLWIDGRAQNLSGRDARRAGVVAPDGPKSLFLPKAAWLMREKPLAYEKTVSFLGCSEYLAFCLTGEKCAFSPSAEFAPYVWTGGECEAYGLDPLKFPPVIFTGSLVGKVRPAATETFGIPPGTPVYAAGPDFLMTLLGTACVRPGRCCDRAGTSEGINVCVEKPVVSPKLRCLPHVIPGYWNAASLVFPTGRLFEWFRAVSGQADVSYEAALAGIEEASRRDFAAGGSRAPLFFPGVETGDEVETAPGVFFHEGRVFPFGDDAITRYGKEALGLAVVRAIGFAVRQAAGELETQGLSVEELRLSGGQAKNPLWNQMKADLTGKTLLVPEIEDAELVGCLAAGFSGSGVYANLQEAAAALVRFKTEYKPDPEKKTLYDDLFAVYKSAAG